MLPKVLLVEDDEIIREIYALKFSLAGFNIEVAENGRVGLEKVHQFQPQVILLDMMMPVMGGQEFLERLGHRGRGIDIIVFSNVSAPKQVAAVRRLGASEYWVKSDYTPERVAEEVARRWVYR